MRKTAKDGKNSQWRLTVASYLEGLPVGVLDGWISDVSYFILAAEWTLIVFWDMV